jgi:hypothetical protein
MPFDPLNQSCRFGCLKHGYGYLRWGAVRKVRQLDEMYPDLSRKNHFLAPTSTIGAPVQHLDLDDLLQKRSHAVAQDLGQRVRKKFLVGRVGKR